MSVAITVDKLTKKFGDFRYVFDPFVVKIYEPEIRPAEFGKLTKTGFGSVFPFRRDRVSKAKLPTH